MAISAKQLGTTLRNAREERGLTVRAIADLLRIDWSLYSKFEAGERPLGKHVRPIARVLGFDADELEALAGGKLPSLAPYLRAKYNLSPEAIAEMQSHLAKVSAKQKRRAPRSKT